MRSAISWRAKLSDEVLLPYSWVILIIAVLVHGSARLPRYMIAPLAPFLQEALGISRAEIGLLSSTALARSFVSLLAAGWLADRVGARRIFLIGLLSLAGSTALAGLDGFLWLLLTLLVASLGSAAGVPPTAQAIAFWFPRRLRGLAMGLKQAEARLAAR